MVVSLTIGRKRDMDRDIELLLNRSTIQLIGDVRFENGKGLSLRCVQQ